MVKKILIVDDERETVDILESALIRQGLKVIHAFDGEEAKQKVLDYEPDIIILDLIMPTLDGWTFLEWLRAEAKSDTPVIVVSAKDQMDDVKRGYTLEADYYIIKPVNIKELIKGINTVYSLKSQRR